MKNNMAIIALSLAVPSSLVAQKKEDDRLAKSAATIQEILEGDNGLPKGILNQAVCVLIYPTVKKIAIGIGGSYGRSALVCRKGAKMNGAWGAPAMYSLDQASAGLQIGSTATDFVLVVMTQKGADQISTRS
jgi:SH3 domain-containing YSC84-like protein 1